MKIPSVLACLTAAATAADPVMIPHPGSPCPPGRTVAWTAAMQMAFDRLLGPKASTKPEKVEQPNPLIYRMNRSGWKEADILPKGGWFAVAGANTPELAGEATKHWRTLAGPEAKAFDGLPPGGLAAYAGIKRNFEFAQAFSSYPRERMNWGGTKVPVRFFGVNGVGARDYEIGVLAYRPAEEVLALQFGAKEGDDRLVLYMPREVQPMDEAIAWVRAWKKQWTGGSTTRQGRSDGDWDDQVVHARDYIRIPEIRLTIGSDLTAAFGGSPGFNGQPQPQGVNAARVGMKLQVDAKGGEFESTADVIDVPISVPWAPAKPRRFWFDKPFFLFLWREKAEHPYAAVWFGNADAFVK